jgi:ABC-2 type transport system permease protein
VRWLLLKDLQILRRSPLQAVLLVLYPVLIAVLVGFAISRGPETPRVAFLNEVPEDARISLPPTFSNASATRSSASRCTPVTKRSTRSNRATSSRR